MSKAVTLARRTKGVVNAFTLAEVSHIAEISLHMLNYLARSGYLTPTYGGGARGARRYYSYRDLAVARIISKFLAAGLEISRLKAALVGLGKEAGWLKPGDLGMIVTDGRRFDRFDANGSLSDATSKAELSFAFVMDVRAVRAEISVKMDKRRLENFDHRNRELQFHYATILHSSN